MARKPGLLDLPAVPRKPWGALGLALNLVPWGGIGSIVVGVKARRAPLVVAGVLQALLTPLIIGWVWSVSWGIGLWMRSRGVVAPNPGKAGKSA